MSEMKQYSFYNCVELTKHWMCYNYELLSMCYILSIVYIFKFLLLITIEKTPETIISLI